LLAAGLVAGGGTEVAHGFGYIVVLYLHENYVFLIKKGMVIFVNLLTGFMYNL